jgi:hypothetical protein
VHPLAAGNLSGFVARHGLSSAHAFAVRDLLFLELQVPHEKGAKYLTSSSKAWQPQQRPCLAQQNLCPHSSP